MPDHEISKTGNAAQIAFSEGLYPKDAVYGAAYIFIDRCYVKLDRSDDGKIGVRLKLKQGVTADLDDLVGEFENEILGQAWRRMITEENKGLIESVTSAALAGAAGPPGLDDLMSMDIDDETAFEDPLGIAMSWEDKYKKGVQKAEPFDKPGDGGTPEGDGPPDGEGKDA